MTLPPSLKEISPTEGSGYKTLCLRIAFAIGMAFLIAQFNLDYIESWLFDLRVSSKLYTPSSEKVELIYITPNTVQAFHGLPGPEQENALLQKLEAAGAKAVVYDFAIDESPGPSISKKNWQTAILADKNVIVAAHSTVLRGEERTLFLHAPMDDIKSIPAPKTADQLNFAKDGVSRRMILTYQGSPMLQVQLASLFNPEITNPANVQGHFNFYGTDQAYIDYHKANTFPAFTFDQILLGKIDASRFKDKIVLIGTDLNLNEDDYARTPLNRSPTAMTRIELQANIIDTLIRNSGPRKLPNYVNWILLGLMSLVTIQIVLTMKPTKGLLILLGTLGGFALLSMILYWLFGLWVPMAHPLLAGFLGYYFFIPYRLIVENRRSWEYYQKNRLLSQVEELKTNFISMMSHDLKTPIARIQGMSDVILSDSQPLSSQQREAVDTIKHSSDDLLKFISAILNYGRIESEGVQLHLQSKDINNVLQEVIRKHEFLAKVKRIQIVPELEPMFPIPMDSDLMKQVLSNLVENAIKYSPEDTKILVSSEEKSDRVVIQVADQGPGIPPDELQNIFMKFFRSKNAKSSPIKGSGLGLYLAKYFTELHKGNITVESNYGNGSTFTVELPMEQGGLNA